MGLCAYQKSIFDKLADGEASSPAGCRASNFQFEPWQFRLWRNHRIRWILRLATLSNFRSRRFAAQAKIGGKRFLLWKMGFSDAKIVPPPPHTGDFADFSNRQNRSALADLKTLRVFNLSPGTIESAKGLRPSRALPWADNLPAPFGEK